MNKIDNWENVQASGEFVPLKIGGHICKIIKAENKTTTTGKDALFLYLDIAQQDGEQAGFYMKQYENSKKENPKWGCIYRQLTEGISASYFKGMITSIEKSNPGYKWNWDEKTLSNKLIGGVFGREQYRASDGKLKFATKCVSVRSTENIKSVPVPEDKLLNQPDFAEMSDDDTGKPPWER